MNSDEDIFQVARMTRMLWLLCSAGIAVSFTLMMTGYWTFSTHSYVLTGLVVQMLIVIGLETTHILCSGYFQHRNIGPAICACLAAIIMCGGSYLFVRAVPDIGVNGLHFEINLMVGVLVAYFALLYGAVMWDRRAHKTVNGDTARGASWLFGSWFFGRKMQPRGLWSRSSAPV
jgi:hypothetical protein